MGKELLGNIELNRIYQMDCLEGMKLIPNKSIDMILCDLPYGTTQCKWDTIIPFEQLWEQYNRVIKQNGAIVLTASQPFTTKLIESNIKYFKYCWYWNKVKPSNHLNAKKQPMRLFEDVCVFYMSQPTYKPQMTQRDKPIKGRDYGTQETYGKTSGTYEKTYTQKYPDGHLVFNKENNTIHPTQKPVALFEYLIKTYTNEEEIILDNCMGSGTTAVACVLNNRKWIGFETDSKYIELANKRLEQIQLEDDLKIYK